MKVMVMLMFTSKYLLDAARMTLWALMNRPSAARVMSSREWEASRAESLDTRCRGWSDHSTCILVTDNVTRSQSHTDDDLLSSLTSYHLIMLGAVCGLWLCIGD